MSYAGVAQGEPGSQNLEVHEGTRIPLVWLPDNEDVRKVRLSSRPCPIPRSQQLDSDEGKRHEPKEIELCAIFYQVSGSRI